MPKVTRRFVCSQCGAMQPKWIGKCPECGAWDALVEQLDQPAARDRHRPERPDAGDDAPQPIDELQDAEPLTRWRSRIAELDRVLGGGLVPASATLIGGDPGIGKSTLLLQAARAWAEQGLAVLYVTSEESVRQTQLRAARLREDIDTNERSRVTAGASSPPTGKLSRAHVAGSSGSMDGNLLVLAQSNVERIRQHVSKARPDVVVVDSIQLVYKPDLPSAPGTVTQLRTCCSELVWQAKHEGHAVLLVGHVTKEGAIAGPKLLEHLVDAVLYLEGERYVAHRLLRAVKNRFGPTHEVGVFEMNSGGLSGVADPAAAWLAEHEPRSGAIVFPMLEGSRVMLVEVQALTARGVPGLAKRKVSGVDPNRVAMILAVLERRANVRLFDRDVFVNVVGGVRATEPAADLPIALAIASSAADVVLPAGTVACGELGLGGELRPVGQLTTRIAEASRLGFKRFLGPFAGGAKQPAQLAELAQSGRPGYVACKSLEQAISRMTQV